MGHLEGIRNSCAYSVVMARSTATTVAAYLKELPPGRRKLVQALRTDVKDNLPAGFVETMNWGMISYEIPLKTFADTYNKQPLSYAAIANQKNHVSLYLMCVYVDPKLREKFARSFEEQGLRFDAGKSCIRFKEGSKVPTKLVAEAVGMFTPAEFIEVYRASRAR